MQVAADGAARAQAEAAVQRQEALASLEVAAAELERVQQQLSVAQVLEPVVMDGAHVQAQY